MTAPPVESIVLMAGGGDDVVRNSEYDQRRARERQEWLLWSHLWQLIYQLIGTMMIDLFSHLRGHLTPARSRSSASRITMAPKASKSSYSCSNLGGDKLHFLLQNAPVSVSLSSRQAYTSDNASSRVSLSPDSFLAHFVFAAVHQLLLLLFLLLLLSSSSVARQFATAQEDNNNFRLVADLADWRDLVLGRACSANYEFWQRNKWPASSRAAKKSAAERLQARP